MNTNITKLITEQLDRNCPTCDRIIKYKSTATFKNANNLNTECQTCCRSGNKNPFFNKTHSAKAKKEISKKLYGIKQGPNKDKGFPGIKNPMAGISVYDFWVKKYGITEANIRAQIRKEKYTIAFSGSNNPMYGKPSPNGSGNGWKGWYKGWYFRSLLELSYMINVIERFNIRWKSAESISIKYKSFDNTARTYKPDFLLNEKYLIEIKPKKLKNSSLVQLKAKAALEFCKLNGLTYKILSPQLIKLHALKELYLSKEIVFIKKSEEKYLKFVQ